eukprot:TRINITY_DN2555_c0_g1_i3.p1 TRINITY_DN2555_c0_g1~~TRINITY_DN2555_c0_g1_i3.p1  ORF type:complete len:127 (+),score=42.55 TRINITY_DN2555_c0_g1_i3:121-501(+)
MQKPGAEEKQLTFQDQQNINAFSRLNNEFHDLEEEIKGKKDLEANLEDASNELILTDEDEIRYSMGEVFVHTARDDVDSLLDKMKDQTLQELEVLEARRDKVLESMAQLKQVLYGKFGDSINLEED